MRINYKQTVRMVIDWDRCIRVIPGDEQFMRQGIPYSCTDCKRWGDYNGKLVFKGDKIPYCEEHRRNYRPSLASPHPRANRGTMKTAPARAA